MQQQTVQVVGSDRRHRARLEVVSATGSSSYRWNGRHCLNATEMPIFICGSVYADLYMRQCVCRSLYAAMFMPIFIENLAVGMDRKGAPYALCHLSCKEEVHRLSIRDCNCVRQAATLAMVPGSVFM